MFTSVKTRFQPHSYPFRWTARVSAVVLFAIWLGFLISELWRQGLADSGINTYGQAAALALVFVGYVVGLRKELMGGVAAILGTLAFVTVVATTTKVFPGIAALLFAVPGVLYLLAWHFDERRQLRL